MAPSEFQHDFDDPGRWSAAGVWRRLCTSPRHDVMPFPLPHPASHLSALRSGIIAVVLAAACCACDAGDHTSISVGTQPTSSPAIVASIGQPVAAQAPFVAAQVCGATGFFTLTFDVVVVPIVPVHVDDVTIQLIDGSVLGGPMIPVPSPRPFASTFVAAGASTTFRLQPSFVCRDTFPRTVRASIIVVNSVGVRNAITVEAPFRVY